MMLAAALLSAYAGAQAPYALPSADPSAIGAVRYSMGVSARFSGQNALAVPDLMRAAALMPGNPDPLVHLGYALLATGEPGKALGAFERALALTPDYEDAREGARIARERLTSARDARPVKRSRPAGVRAHPVSAPSTSAPVGTPVPPSPGADESRAERWTAAMSVENVAGRTDLRTDLVLDTDWGHAGLALTRRSGQSEGRALSLYAERVEDRFFYRGEIRAGEGGFSDYALTAAAGTREEERFGWGVRATLSGGEAVSLIAEPLAVIAADGWRASAGPSLFLMGGELSVGAWAQVEAYRGDTVWRLSAGRRYEEDAGLAVRVDTISGFASFPINDSLRGTVSLGGEERGRGWEPAIGAGLSVRF